MLLYVYMNTCVCSCMWGYIYMCIGVEDKHQGSSLSWYPPFFFFQRQADDLGPSASTCWCLCYYSCFHTVGDQPQGLVQATQALHQQSCTPSPWFFVWLFFVCVHVLVIHVCIWMCACRYVWRLEGNIRCVSYKTGSPSEPATHQVS